MIDKSPQLKTNVQECRKNDIEKFKAVVMSLQTTSKHSRTTDQRVASIDFVETLTRSSSVKRVTTYLLLSLPEFIAWQKFHFDLSKEDATDKWFVMLNRKDAHVEENDDGELVLATRKPTELAMTDQMSHSKSKQIAPVPMDSQKADNLLGEKVSMPLVKDLNSTLFASSKGILSSGKAPYIDNQPINRQAMNKLPNKGTYLDI